MQQKISAIALLTVIATASALFGQVTDNPGPSPAEPTPAGAADPAHPDRPVEAPPKTAYRIAAGAAHQLSTDFDPDVAASDVGSFSMTRYGLAAGVSYPISETDLSIAHRLTYEYDDYNFSDAVPFSRNDQLRSASDPWADSHLLSYSLQLSYRLNHDWSIFGGPTIGVVGESGAEPSDALTYGGIFGVRQQVSPDLGIGIGVIAATGLENSQVLPLILIDWKISDRLHLRNGRPQPGLRGTAGAQLDYEIAPRWTLGAGFAYDRRRFRLDDDGVAPDGIAQNSAFPVYMRAGYELNDHWSFSALAGILLGGELRLEDDDGHQIGKTDYDSAPFFGASAAYTF